MEFRPNENLELANVNDIGNLINSIDHRMMLVGPQGANHDEFPILQNIKGILESVLKGRTISKREYEMYLSQVTEIINKSSNYH